MAKTILIKPVITEKVNLLQEEKNQYAFEVDVNATKVDIQHAIQKKFNVKVELLHVEQEAKKWNNKPPIL